MKYQSKYGMLGMPLLYSYRTGLIEESNAITVLLQECKCGFDFIYLSEFSLKSVLVTFFVYDLVLKLY